MIRRILEAVDLNEGHMVDLCPECGAKIIEQCRCRFSEGTCEQGHRSIICPVHGRVPLLIENSHAIELSRTECICDQVHGKQA